MALLLRGMIVTESPFTAYDPLSSIRFLHTIVRLCVDERIQNQNEKHDAKGFSDVHGKQITSINIEHAARGSLAKYDVVTLEQRHR